MLRRLIVAGTVVGVLLVGAAPAWAHVTIDPTSAPKGSDAVLTFTVPNEMDNASTTQLVVSFPTDHPIAEASVEPVAGWTANVESTHSEKPIKTDEGETNDRVSRVTWSGGPIEPGDFQQFKIAVGLPDDANSLVFKALQTYSNGTVVRWIETAAPGAAEPEHPAPVLTLTGGRGATVALASSSTKSDDDSDTLATVAIILGGLALIAAVVALVLSSRKRQAAA